MAMNNLETHQQDAEEAVLETVRILQGLYGDRLDKIVLFGSRARGDAEPDSDIDLMVVLREMERSLSEFRYMAPAILAMPSKYSSLVQIFPVSSENYEKATKPVVQNARAEGILVG